MPYINKDGLAWNFGVEEAELGNVAGYTTDGPKRVTEVVIYWGDLPTVAQNSVIIDYNCKLPKGALITDVEILPQHEDFVGSGATLNIGWVDADDRTSNVDVDAFVVEATIAELNAGGLNLAGWVGAAVQGAPLTEAKLLTWEVNTAAITAGQTTVLISWMIPKGEADTLVYVKP